MGKFPKTAGGRVIVACGGTILLLASLTLAFPSRVPYPSLLRMMGIAQDPCNPAQVFAVPVGTAGSYYADTSVLRAPGGVYIAAGRIKPLTGAMPSCLRLIVQAEQHWIQSGFVPGMDQQQRAIATRALLDLYLSVRPNGAVIAGWSPGWDYVWPRDSSWVATALADTGHPAEAFKIMTFLERVQPGSGIWAARYWPDSGKAVRDGRPAELDADGWVPWAVWSWLAAAHQAGDPSVRQELARLWPMVMTAADAAAGSLTDDGLPVAAMDYWENSVQVTLGTAAPLLVGLRAAADIASAQGDGAKARQWAAAAARLSAGISAGFSKYGFPRVAFDHSGVDAAVTFLGPPFADPGSGVRHAAAVAQKLLQQTDGGLRPGSSWSGAPEMAWTAETAFFALFDAGTGQRPLSDVLMAWLAAHRTSLGELPEQVNGISRPVSVAPLAWTDAVILLALLAQGQQLASVPVPGSPQASRAAEIFAEVGVVPVRRHAL